MKESEIYRKCCSCTEKKSRDNLIRVTKNSLTGEVRINPDSFFFGRSVYVCRNKLCVENAFKKDRIFKFLKIKASETLKEKIRAVLDR